MEGAGPWATLRRVTLPVMGPTLLLLVLRDTIYSFQTSFVPALVITDGGPPEYATTFLPLFVYRNGFEYLRFGYAAAATVVMLGADGRAHRRPVPRATAVALRPGGRNVRAAWPITCTGSSRPSPRPLYRGLLRVRVEGREHVPPSGGVIVAANHVSFFDSVALLQSIPRRAYFIGKAEYLDSWTTRHLFPAMGLIPIDREQARKAMAALEVAAGVLDRGDALGHLPGGHPLARRSAAPRPHRRRPAGADVGGPDRAGRPGRHRPDPTDRRQGPPPVPPRRRALRRAARPGGVRRIVAPSPPAAHRRPDGGHPPAQPAGR